MRFWTEDKQGTAFGKGGSADADSLGYEVRAKTELSAAESSTAEHTPGVPVIPGDAGTALTKGLSPSGSRPRGALRLRHRGDGPHAPKPTSAKRPAARFSSANSEWRQPQKGLAEFRNESTSGTAWVAKGSFLKPDWVSSADPHPPPRVRDRAL